MEQEQQSRQCFSRLNTLRQSFPEGVITIFYIAHICIANLEYIKK